MDALTRCKAMEAFCRQQAEIESEAAEFWLSEADSWKNRRLALSRSLKLVPNPDKQQDRQ